MAKTNNAAINEMVATIATAQTVVEQAPLLLNANEKGFTCSIDLLTTLLNMVMKKPLDQIIVEKVAEKLTDNSGSWLMYIEDTFKLALLVNFTSMLTCEMSPLIPDKLIGAGEFLEGSDRQINFSGEGITIPVSAIDFTGLLKHCPTDENDVLGQSNYLPCYKPGTENEKLSIRDAWKHTDFNAFLWFVKNKGTYGNLAERRKLIWDNRYKTRIYEKPIPKKEDFFTKSHKTDSNIRQDGVVPFDADYLIRYNEGKKGKNTKKQILECRFIQGDGVQPDSFQFRIPASTYYKTRRIKKKTGTEEPHPITSIFALNKTIFEFNADFVNSLKLFDIKTYLCQVLSNLFGTGNFSVGISGEFDISTEIDTKMEDTINQIIDNVIKENDLNESSNTSQDCFFTFSNEQYINMMKNSMEKRLLSQGYSNEISETYENIVSYDFDNATEGDKQAMVTDTLKMLQEMKKNPKVNVSANFNLQHTNIVFDLIRMLVYPLIRPLFSPKVITLLMINLQVMGDPLKLKEKIPTWEDIAPYLTNVAKNIITQIKDMIVEMIYSLLIEYLAPLISMFTLKILFEQIEHYRRLIMNMIESCAGFSGFSLLKKFNMSSEIPDVRYADIYPTEEKPKDEAKSKTNC